MNRSIARDDFDKLREIMELHDEACAAAMALDGHCKSSEGAVSVNFTDYFDRRDGHPPLAIKSVSVYAYVVGPSRQHYFDSLDEALTAVRKWHKETMEWVAEERAEIAANA